jgi:hypothetical protein
MPVHLSKQRRDFGNSMNLASTPIVDTSTTHKGYAPTTLLDGSSSLMKQSRLTWLQITRESQKLFYWAPHSKTHTIWGKPPRPHIGCCFWAPYVPSWRWSGQIFFSKLPLFHRKPNYYYFGNSGILKNSLTFFVSTFFSIAGTVLILIGASIWTVIIKRTEDVNALLIGQPPVPVGIVVSAGSALFLTWAAFACMVVSVVPYMIRYVLAADQRSIPS